MKLDNIKRILVEDFNQKDREMVERLSYVINAFMEQVVDLSDRQVDLTNLKDDIVTFKIEVDADGLPVGNDKFKSRVVRPIGLSVINVSSDESVVMPIATPLIEFTSSSDIVRIKRMSGLLEGVEYMLTVRAFSGV